MTSISTAADFLQSIRRVSADNCQVCETPTTKKCGRCKTAIYCSTGCQSSEWKNHRTICKPQDKNSWTQSKIDFLSQKILEIESATSDTPTETVNLHIVGYLASKKASHYARKLNSNTHELNVKKYEQLLKDDIKHYKTKSDAYQRAIIAGPSLVKDDNLKEIESGRFLKTINKNAISFQNIAILEKHLGIDNKEAIRSRDSMLNSLKYLTPLMR